MALKEELKQDIIQVLKEIDDLLPEGKVKTLEILFDKYCHLSSSPIGLDLSDLGAIKQLAAKKYIDQSADLYLEGIVPRRLSTGDVVALRTIEATIDYLQSKDCLKKLPNFRYYNKTGEE